VEGSPVVELLSSPALPLVASPPPTLHAGTVGREDAHP